jgi:hypothetical protein
VPAPAAAVLERALVGTGIQTGETLERELLSAHLTGRADALAQDRVLD